MIKSIHPAALHAKRPTTDELCTDLMQALHSASQPLTILRASLDMHNIQGKSDEEIRRLLKQSDKEVERLCLIFSFIQQFVLIGSIDAEIQNVSVSDLLDHTLEGVDLLFAEAGISLKVKNIDQISSLALLDASRFQHALSVILLVVLDRAIRGDDVVVSCRLKAAGIQIEILTENAKTISSQTRLSMALAATNLRSQGAELTWQEQPFEAHIALSISKSPVSTPQ